MSFEGAFSWQELLAPLRGVRPLIAGIVNATADSFSDGRGCIDPLERTEFALKLLDEGADIIDLGGESTRPGAKEVPPEEEWARIEPVLTGILAQRAAAVISIDTRHSFTAVRSLHAGAKIINDVSGMQFDPEMGKVIASYGAGAILNHASAEPEFMQDKKFIISSNAVETVSCGLQKILENARLKGIQPQQIMLDVGIGFGKDRSANYLLLRNARRFEEKFALPFCWGVSRKSLLKSSDDTREKRIAGSLALAVKLAEQHVSLLRVHDVAQTAAALAAAREFEAAQ